jgi:hypothetical protein
MLARATHKAVDARAKFRYLISAIWRERFSKHGSPTLAGSLMKRCL